MPETTTQPTSIKRTETSLFGQIAFGCLGLLLIGIILAYAVLYFGRVKGEEFSSDSFRRRGFAYLEIPLIGAQISPLRHTDTTNDLEKYLAAEKLFPKPTKPENRWDLVTGTQGRGSSVHGDAHILCQYTDAMNKDGDSIWLEWSEGHLEMAKVLWPAVAEAARHELYSFVPDLFILARSASTPEELQQRIDQVLADKYLLTAETLEALDQEEVASELFAAVLRHAPERAEAVRGRDKSAKPNATEQSADGSSSADEAEKSQ